jgi:hypothetical protein
MYTIDAYDIPDQQSCQDSAWSRAEAYRKARRLANVWPNVEIREVLPSGSTVEVAAWIAGQLAIERA